MAEKDAITQKPFWGPHNMVATRMLQIQHTVGNLSLTWLKEALNMPVSGGFRARFGNRIRSRGGKHAPKRRRALTRMRREYDGNRERGSGGMWQGHCREDPAMP